VGSIAVHFSIKELDEAAQAGMIQIVPGKLSSDVRREQKDDQAGEQESKLLGRYDMDHYGHGVPSFPALPGRNHGAVEACLASRLTGKALFYMHVRGQSNKAVKRKVKALRRPRRTTSLGKPTESGAGHGRVPVLTCERAPSAWL